MPTVPEETFVEWPVAWGRLTGRFESSTDIAGRCSMICGEGKGPMNRQLFARVAVSVTVLASLGAFLLVRGPASGSGPATTIQPNADAFVNSWFPAKNFGTNQMLWVDASGMSAYLRFDVEGLTAPVESATLRVYSESTRPLGFDVHGVADNSWDEQSITSENAPAVDPSVVGSSGALGRGEWTSVDVTALVNGNGPVSLALTSNNAHFLNVSSREGDNPPELVIQTEEQSGPETQTPVNTQIPATTSTPVHTAPITPTPESKPSDNPSPVSTPKSTPTPKPKTTATPTQPPTPSPAPTKASTPSPTPSASIPSFDHIYVIVMENKEYGSIVGSSNAPYMNQLIRQNGLATNYDGVSHPSEPNYLALWAGGTYGVKDDGVYDLNGETIADQLEAAGKSWMVYSENYPDAKGCYTGATASGGADGSGTYVRKHNPAISFTSVSQNSQRCAQHLSNFSNFRAATADFNLIVPNMCHDMHDCDVATGDSWLQSWLPSHILNTPTWQQTNSAVIITFDEGSSGQGGGGHIPTIVISKHTPAGYTSGASANHYTLLHTIQESFGIGCLKNSCGAGDLKQFFGQP